MLQTQFELMVALDSCIVIELVKNPKFAKRLTKFFCGKHSRVVIQDVVFKETEKILHLPKEVILKKICCMLGKEVFVFATNDILNVDAKRIESQYQICHYPDSVIIAAARDYSWTLLSFDRNLLRATEFESVIAFNPLKLGRI